MTHSQRLLAPGDGLRQWWADLSRPGKWIFGVVGFALLGLLPLHTPGFLDTPGISFGGTMAAFVMVAIIAVGLNVVVNEIPAPVVFWMVPPEPAVPVPVTFTTPDAKSKPKKKPSRSSRTSRSP